MNIKIRNLTLGALPRVVGIVDYIMPPQLMNTFAGLGVDIFEVRADLIGEPIDAVIDYVERVREEVQAPLIGTIRETDHNREHRAEWLTRLARYVDCVDIELGMPEWRSVADSVPESTLIMISEHNFNETPDLAGLGGIVDRALEQNADIVKIAVMATCPSDVTRLMRFTEDCDVPLVTISMGDIGVVSRIIAPLFGSLFSYGYLSKAIVPGQLSAEEIIRAMKEYYPTRR